MNNLKLAPYIFFKGDCEEAMRFYQEVFGGELSLHKFGEQGEEIPEGFAGKISFAELISDGLRLRAVDSPIANPEARKVELQVFGDDEKVMREIFKKLAEGGKAKHEMEEKPWGGISGRLFDKFSLDWVVSVPAKK